MGKYFLLLLLPFIGFSQKQSLDKQLLETYDNFRETSLDVRRFKHEDIQPLIDSLKGRNDFKITVLGRSIQGRNISLLTH